MGWGHGIPSSSSARHSLRLRHRHLLGCIRQVSYWFPQAKQGRALAIYGGVGNVAPGVFSFLLPVALASLGLAKS
jgi:hypothetical protein